MQNQVNEVVGVMRDNVGKVLERGDKLEDLQVSQNKNLPLVDCDFVFVCSLALIHFLLDLSYCVWLVYMSSCSVCESLVRLGHRDWQTA